MTRDILAECEGLQVNKNTLTNYTPLILDLAQEIGLINAAVYGVVLRFSQKIGTCHASAEVMAGYLGINSKTVYRGLRKLMSLGYLVKEIGILETSLHATADPQTCGYCQINPVYTQVHHIVFLSEGGDDTPENRVYLCPTCHILAHAYGYKPNWKGKT